MVEFKINILKYLKENYSKNLKLLGVKFYKIQFYFFKFNTI